MKDAVSQLFVNVLADMGIADVSPVVTRSEDSVHGEYTTNVAMILAKALRKNPMEIAKEIQDQIIKHQKASTVLWLEKVEIASPGFVNLFLSEANLINRLGQVLNEGNRFGMVPIAPAKEGKSGQKGQVLEGKSDKKVLASKATGKQQQKGDKNLRTYAASGDFAENKLDRQDSIERVMIEFTDANPFKEFHIGHLRNIALGESFSRLLEAVGHEVRRVSYQGDVGMHVAKALYALLHVSHITSHISKVKTPKEKAQLLGQAYAMGAKAFEDPSADGEKAKKEIIEINKKVYRQDPSIIPLWKEGRQWSLDYFDTIYERLGTKFTRFYFESEVAPLGAAIVADHIKDGIFEKSDGAIIFRGEKFGLHTRVFISKEGYATYEAKDLALAPLKYSEYPYDLSIIMTANEQTEYFKVMLAALTLISPDLAQKTRHISYGMVRLTEGKMSSRTGNVITADWLIDQAKSRIHDILDKNTTKYSKEVQKDIGEKAAIAAVKYSMLKVTASSDIAFDLEKSVSLDGDSGPYLQYTYARCKSVLRKKGDTKYEIRDKQNQKDLVVSRLTSHVSLNLEERAVIRRISQFPEVVAEAARDFAPNTLCTYLFHLAQEFNLFYAKHSILGSDTRYVKRDMQNQKDLVVSRLTPALPRGRSHVSLRLALTAATAQVLKNGLYLLGIATLEQM